jgi:hypothetical protein
MEVQNLANFDRGALNPKSVKIQMFHAKTEKYPRELGINLTNAFCLCS